MTAHCWHTRHKGIAEARGLDRFCLDDDGADAAVLYGAYGLHYGGIAATNAALGHAVAYTAGGVTHSSNV